MMECLKSLRKREKEILAKQDEKNISKDWEDFMVDAVKSIEDSYDEEKPGIINLIKKNIFFLKEKKQKQKIFEELLNNWQFLDFEELSTREKYFKTLISLSHFIHHRSLDSIRKKIVEKKNVIDKKYEALKIVLNNKKDIF